METEGQQNVVEFDGIEVEIIDEANIAQEAVEMSSTEGGKLNKEVEELSARTNPEDLEPSPIMGQLLGISPDSPTFSEAIYQQLEGVPAEPQAQVGDILQPQEQASSPLHQGQVELGSTAESNESFLHHDSPNPDPFTFDASILSLLGTAETELPPASGFFSSHFPDIDQGFSIPLDLDETLNFPLTGDSGQPNVQQVETDFINAQMNHSVESLQMPIPTVPGNTFSANYQFVQNFISSNINQNQQHMVFPHSLTGMNLQSVNLQINQWPTTWLLNYQNDPYNGFSQSLGPQTNEQLRGTPRFDQQSSNFMRPKPSVPIRPQFQRLNPVPRTPDGMNMQLPYPITPQQANPVPGTLNGINMHHPYLVVTPQQANLVNITPNGMIKQLPYPVQPQQLDPVARTSFGINMQPPYPVQPQQPSSSMPVQLMPQHYRPIQQPNLTPAAQNTFLRPQAFQPIMFTEQPIMQQSTQGWMNPSFNQVPVTQNANFRNRPQGSISGTVRPVPSYLTPRSSLSSRVLNSLPTPEYVGLDLPLSGDPYQLGTTPSNTNQQGRFGEQGNAPRRSLETGESPSSPFKRFRTEPSVAHEASDQNEQRSNPSDLENNVDLNSQTLWNPGPMKNSLYDPLFEGLGLPIDPHLRGLDFNLPSRGWYG